MKKQLDFYFAGSEVKRYHTVRTLVEETVGHHSHGVAFICLLLDQDASQALLKAALVHDLAEHLVGDIPSPAKRAFGIGATVSELEDRLLEESGIGNPNLLFEEARTLKLADIFSGMLFCLREMQLGNLGMKVIYDRYTEYALSMSLEGRESELFNLIQDKRYGV